jgi:hypothetical protein
LINSGSARLTASADRSGSCVGIVAKGSSIANFGRPFQSVAPQAAGACLKVQAHRHIGSQPTAEIAAATEGQGRAKLPRSLSRVRGFEPNSWGSSFWRYAQPLSPIAPSAAPCAPGSTSTLSSPVRP